MKAWRVPEYGPYQEVLRWETDVPAPEPEGASVRIRVRAAGVNFADTLRIAGKYQVKTPVPFTPGAEAVGEVTAVGSDSRFAVGDRVMAMGLTGAFGEEAIAPDLFAWKIPASIPEVDAAAMVVTYQTSHLALHRRARMQPGETLLVHGGAGGVGTAAIQLGKALGGTVIATAGSADKLEVCERAGADHVINYKDEDFVQRTKELTGGRGADVIYDPVGGDVFDKSTKCIAWEGRLVVIGFASGRIPEIAANRILLKNMAVVGLNWPNYATEDHATLDATQDDLVRLYGEGKIKPILYGVWSLDRLPEALDAVQGRRSYGKIVLTPEGEGA